MVHRPCFSLLMVMVLTFSMSPLASAEGLVFAIIPHATHDGNFIDAFEAARDEAAKHGDRILFLGEDGVGNPRLQHRAVKHALTQGVDGIALAPLNARFLIDNSIPLIQAQKIPLVLFESDFPEQHRHLRAGFIGTDGVALGRALGQLAKRFKPDGGAVALMRNNPGHPSIERRLQGIRQELSGNPDFSGARLTGEGGWREHPRTPWEAWNDYDQALAQLTYSLKSPDIEVFISAGWWPQMANAYAKELAPYKPLLDDKRKIVIVGDAAPVQLQYLAQGLAHGNVSQDFPAMGRYLYRYLKQLHRGQSIPDTTHTPVRTFTASR